jgi:hypothetical protein
MIDEAMTHKVKLIIDNDIPHIWLDGFELKHVTKFHLDGPNSLDESGPYHLTFEVFVTTDQSDDDLHTIHFTEDGHILLDHFMLRWVEYYACTNLNRAPDCAWLEATLLVRSVNG